MASPAVQRVSLAPARERPAAPAALDTRGARVVLGTPGAARPQGTPAVPIVPARDTLFGPRGMAVAADGSLWVADTGHHRLLGWAQLPGADDMPADWQLGQPDFGTEGRNGRGPVTAASLNVPTGVCAIGEGLAVADAWNHRVLIWHHPPRAARPADLVLGQQDFGGGAINRGAALPAADTLYWPYGVYWDGDCLWVADTGNRRVLRWSGRPASCGQPADLVLGQPDFVHRDENAGGPGWGSLRWPHALAHWRGQLCVADAGNNRVLLWPPSASHAATGAHALPIPAADTPRGGQAGAGALLGQADEYTLDHNRGQYWPSAHSLNMPYGLAVHRDRLLVADTANSRILRFEAPPGTDEHAYGPTAAGPGRADAPAPDATAVAGQPSFADKGDNRWQPPARDSLCWPYALAVHDNSCLVADSGNNRVLVWDLAP